MAILRAHCLDALLPILALVCALEFWALGRRRFAVYQWRETLASVGLVAGQKLANVIALLVVSPVFEWAWQHRLWTLPMDRVWGIALLFLGVELAYYWQHRLSHDVRWMWASHAVHHTAEQINFSATYRLGWTDLLSGIPFVLLPLAFLGCPPRAILTNYGLLILYQFWLHTELVPRLGWFDWIFNSPSNHRVHHANNPSYIDRNYGGILVVFDHLFGTFAVQRLDEPLRYGLDERVPSYNPFVLAFHEWAALLKDLSRSRSLGHATRACFGRPDRTSRQVQDKLLAPCPKLSGTRP